MSKGFASNYRIVLLATGLFTCFAGLGVRLVWLHVIVRDDLLRSVVKARRQVFVDNARRGDILDKNGGILATSRSLMVLGVDPQVLRKEDEAKWPQLAALIGMPLPDLQKIFTTKFRPAAPANPVNAASPASSPAGLVINFKLPDEPAAPVAADAAPKAPAEAVADDEASVDGKKNPVADGDDTELDEADTAGRRQIRFAKLSDQVTETAYAQIEKLGIKGVYGTRIYRRAYPHGQLAAHIVGYVNSTQQPATGIERSADFYLRGQNGWRESEKDGTGRRELAQFRSREVPRADGYSVKLSIDANVQDIVEQELAAIAQKYQPKKATIIVSDPRTGFILGLGNYPTFNLNDYNRTAKETPSTLNNAALTDVYEPGSVFKIVAASGALEEELVTPASTFDCTLATVEYHGTTRHLPAEDKSDHFDKPLSVAEIIAHSSNKGAAQLAMLMGDDRFYGYARSFGFGQRTGLPGGHEEPGLMKAPANWDGLTITRMPMGQGIAVTVMQMHQAMSVIASGGTLLRPQVVQEIRDASGEVVCRFDRSEAHRVISERTAKTMARLLAAVASAQGNAVTAAIPGYEVAGKTGTAQKIVDGKYSTKHHVASFVGFFPASNPQVAISVIIDDADARAPGGTAFGATVAAPSFKHIGEQLIPYLSINAPAPTAPVPMASDRPAFAVYQGGRR